MKFVLVHLLGWFTFTCILLPSISMVIAVGDCAIPVPGDTTSMQHVPVGDIIWPTNYALKWPSRPSTSNWI